MTMVLVDRFATKQLNLIAHHELCYRGLTMIMCSIVVVTSILINHIAAWISTTQYKYSSLTNTSYFLYCTPYMYINLLVFIPDEIVFVAVLWWWRTLMEVKISSWCTLHYYNWFCLFITNFCLEIVPGGIQSDRSRQLVAYVSVSFFYSWTDGRWIHSINLLYHCLSSVILINCFDAIAVWNFSSYSRDLGVKVSSLLGGNATLCVSPIAIVDDVRRRDKMFNAKYLANYITYLQKYFHMHFLGNACKLRWKLGECCFVGRGVWS
jgi:hypothetical protein